MFSGKSAKVNVSLRKPPIVIFSLSEPSLNRTGLLPGFDQNQPRNWVFGIKVILAATIRMCLKKLRANMYRRSIPAEIRVIRVGVRQFHFSNIEMCPFVSKPQ